MECEQRELIEQMKACVDRHNERLHSGDLLMQEIHIKLNSISEQTKQSSDSLKQMHSRMFVDNGKKSFQSSLARMGVQINLQWFILGAFIVASVSAVIKSVIG